MCSLQIFQLILLLFRPFQVLCTSLDALNLFRNCSALSFGVSYEFRRCFFLPFNFAGVSGCLGLSYKQKVQQFSTQISRGVHTSKMGELLQINGLYLSQLPLLIL